MRRTVLLLTLLAGGCDTAPTIGPPNTHVDASPVTPDGGPPDASDAGAPDAAFSCTPGATGCFGRVYFVCGDDGASREDEVVCDAGCDEDAGCGACEPGARVCDGTVSLICDVDGGGWYHGRDCAESGSACVGSYCADPCAQAEAARSYMGCEYYAVPLAQPRELDARNFGFRIVVANPSPRTVEVTVRRGQRIETRRRIVPGGLVDIALPWIDGVSFPNGAHWDSSSVVPDGAYRVTSDFPVIVSQYSPFHYATFEPRLTYSYTNDASLLLPTHALGLEHVAASYFALSNAAVSLPGFVAVVGTAPEGTTVEVRAAGRVAADPDGRWGVTEPGETITLTLARGEVAQLIGAPPPLCTPERAGSDSGFCLEPETDLTGSRVTSDRPVAVFSGHVCANVPFDVVACDHLETQLAPVSTWGERFETMAMREPDTSAANLIRVIAARDGTHVTFEPPIEGRGGADLDRGTHVELRVTDAVSIRADAPIQVAQLLLGQHQTEPPLLRGDPSVTVLVPAEQFRYDYVFVTPSSYADTPEGRSYLLVARTPGVAIELDGATMEASWTAAGERELAIVPVTGGPHRATSAAPFGLIAFGLGSYTSYAHPAGLDLHTLR